MESKAGIRRHIKISNMRYKIRNKSDFISFCHSFRPAYMQENIWIAEISLYYVIFSECHLKIFSGSSAPGTLATRAATVSLYRRLLRCCVCLHLKDLLCTLTGDSGFVRGRRTGLRRLVAKWHEKVLAELFRQFALQERLHEDLEALEVDLLEGTSETARVVVGLRNVAVVCLCLWKKKKINERSQKINSVLVCWLCLLCQPLFFHRAVKLLLPQILSIGWQNKWVQTEANKR